MLIKLNVIVFIKTAILLFKLTVRIKNVLIFVGMMMTVVETTTDKNITLEDLQIRAERAANLSHMTGLSRKIQMYIKNRYLQILPDGTVKGSNDDMSDYTIFQRKSVLRGQLKIQATATCFYLCMNSSGLLYGSKTYTNECLFKEILEQHNYNSYSSVRWSTQKKILYVGLNKHGYPRRVQVKDYNLGRLSSYARVLTRVVSSKVVRSLYEKFSVHNRTTCDNFYRKRKARAGPNKDSAPRNSFLQRAKRKHGKRPHPHV